MTVPQDTPEHAETLIAAFRKKYGWKMRAYQCPTCLSYHPAKIQEKKRKI